MGVGKGEREKVLYYWRLELYGGDNHAFKGLIFHVHVLIKLSSRDIGIARTLIFSTKAAAYIN